MLFMQVDPEKLANWNHVAIPTLTAAEKAGYDVAKETERLYQVHLRSIRKDGIDSLNAMSEFTELALRWLAVNDGWDNVDKTIKARYPKRFIATVGYIKQSIARTNNFIDAQKSASCRAHKAQTESSTKTTTRRSSGQSFDVVGATRALFRFSQKALRSPNPQEFEPMFAQLATIWISETGGIDKVDKTILDPYPGWFKGKLDIFQSDPLWAHSMKVTRNRFSVEEMTSDLFEKAKQCFPDAARNANAKPATPQLDMEFYLLAVYWTESIGGWHNVDQAIRNRYPSWFVRKIDAIAKKLPMAKMMAFDDWNKRPARK